MIIIKLTVGLKGDEENAQRIILEPKEALYEVFIGAPPKISANGRTGIDIMDVNKIKKIRNISNLRNTKLNILLNSVTLTPSTKLDDFIDKMEELKVDYYTVANDEILEYMLNKRYKKNASFGIVLSTFMYITKIKQIEKYSKILNLNDRIIVNQNENRNFIFLKEVIKNSQIPIELFANTLCLQNCFDNIHNHSRFMATYSNKGFIIDPYFNNCISKRIKNPMLILTSPIIRPEDVITYEKIGIEYFKLGTRSFTTDQTLTIISAYQNRKWNGDLAELNGTVNVDVNKYHPVSNRTLDNMINQLLLGEKKQNIIYQSYLNKIKGEHNDNS